MSRAARKAFRFLLGISVLLLATGTAHGIRLNLDRPGDREFVRDLAGMIADADETKIRAVCDKLLTDKATPILVVTIESMAGHGGANLRIETFARLLFDQWGIGHPELQGQPWNTGILLLVSEGDRKARIELSAGWGRRQDSLCRQIMDEQIISRFKQGDFSGGIVAGVESLDKMARGLRLPGRPRSKSHYILTIGSVLLGLFTVVSLARRGSSGWAWLFWAAVFALIGAALYHVVSNSSSGSGGFSGGSFGGGSSGGGGATGSW